MAPIRAPPTTPTRRSMKQQTLLSLNMTPMATPPRETITSGSTAATPPPQVPSTMGETQKRTTRAAAQLTPTASAAAVSSMIATPASTPSAMTDATPARARARAVVTPILRTPLLRPRRNTSSHVVGLRDPYDQHTLDALREECVRRGLSIQPRDQQHERTARMTKSNFVELLQEADMLAMFERQSAKKSPRGSANASMPSSSKRGSRKVEMTPPAAMRMVAVPARLSTTPLSAAATAQPKAKAAPKTANASKAKLKKPQPKKKASSQAEPLTQTATTKEVTIVNPPTIVRTSPPVFAAAAPPAPPALSAAPVQLMRLAQPAPQKENKVHFVAEEAKKIAPRAAAQRETVDLTADDTATTTTTAAPNATTIAPKPTTTTSATATATAAASSSAASKQQSSVQPAPPVSSSKPSAAKAPVAVDVAVVVAPSALAPAAVPVAKAAPVQMTVNAPTPTPTPTPGPSAAAPTTAVAATPQAKTAAPSVAPTRSTSAAPAEPSSSASSSSSSSRPVAVARARRGCRFRLINVLMSPDFNTRWREMHVAAPSRGDVNVFWRDVHISFLCQNSFYDKVHFEDALFDNVAPSGIQNHSAQKLQQMWAEIVMMYRRTWNQTKKAAEPKPFLDSCAGRLDLLYLHMGLLLEPELHKLIVQDAATSRPLPPAPSKTASARTQAAAAAVAAGAGAGAGAGTSKPGSSAHEPNNAIASAEASESTAPPSKPSAATRKTAGENQSARIASRSGSEAAGAADEPQLGAGSSSSSSMYGQAPRFVELQNPDMLPDWLIEDQAKSAVERGLIPSMPASTAAAAPSTTAKAKKTPASKSKKTGSVATRKSAPPATASSSSPVQTRDLVLHSSAINSIDDDSASSDYETSDQTTPAPPAQRRAPAGKGKRRRENAQSSDVAGAAVGETDVVEVPTSRELVPHPHKRLHSTAITTTMTRSQEVILPPDEFDVMHHRLRKVNESIDQCYRTLSNNDAILNDMHREDVEADLRFYFGIKKRIQEQIVMFMHGY